MSIIYKGWSTYSISPTNTNSNLYNIDLVKQDLLNELMTRKGERVMLPNYGCEAWDLLFEPMSDAVETDLKNNMKEIVEHDPRLEYIDCEVTEITHGYTINLTILYIPTKTVTQLLVSFQDEYSGN